MCWVTAPALQAGAGDLLPGRSLRVQNCCKLQSFTAARKCANFRQIGTDALVNCDERRPEKYGNLTSN